MALENTRGSAQLQADEPEVGNDDGVATAGLKGRLHQILTKHPRTVMFALVAGIFIVGSPIGFWYFLTVRAELSKPPLTVASAFNLLDNGRYAEARELADRLQESLLVRAEATKEAPKEKEGKDKKGKKGQPSAEAQPDADDTPKLSPQDQAAIATIRGMAAIAEAEATPNQQDSTLYSLAARYLEDARQLGFPPGREAAGLAMLGKSLYRSNQLALSKPVLEEALKLHPPRSGEIHWMLADIHLRQPTPALAEAWQNNLAARADNSLSPELHHNAMLQGIRILLAQGKIADSAAMLDQIPPGMKNSPEILLARGELTMAQARLAKATSEAQADALYHEAIQLLRAAQNAAAATATTDSHAANVVPASLFLLGMCLLETGDTQGALQQFVRTRTMFPGTPAALAALVEEADLLQRENRASDALAAYQQVLNTVGPIENFNNPWISLNELRQRISNVYLRSLEAKDFATCIDLARHWTPLFPRDRAVELMAEAYRDWGQKLLDNAERQPLGESEKSRLEGRAHMRAAGQAFDELARLRFATPLYQESIWNAALASFKGRNYRHATVMLEEYLKHDTQQRHATALEMLGESLFNQGHFDDTLKIIEDFLRRYPRDASAARARLTASQIYQEKGDLKQAAILLQENLDSDALTPLSIEWRQSLFELGRLLRHEKRHEEAILRLEEVVARYPDWPRSANAQYLVADSYRQLASLIEEGLSKVLVESTRIQHIRRIEQARQAALAHFQKVRDLLARRQEMDELRPEEKVILRNCYFGVGDMFFQLGQYDDALKAYQIAIQRYNNRPEILEAYTQVAAIARRLNRPAEAQSALEDAKELLNRIKEDPRFLETTNSTPKQWQERLAREWTVVSGEWSVGSGQWAVGSGQ